MQTTEFNYGEPTSFNYPQSPQELVSGRVCNSCGTFKDWSKFDKKPKGVNGHDSRCKICIAEKKIEIREKKKKLKRVRKGSKVLEVSSFKVDKEYHSIERDKLTDVMKDLIEVLIISG